MVHYKTRIINR